MTKELSLAQLTLRNLELRRAEGNQSATDQINKAYEVEESAPEYLPIDTSLLQLASEEQVNHSVEVRKDGINHWRNTKKRIADQSGTRFESCAITGSERKRVTTEDIYVDANLKRIALDYNEDRLFLLKIRK